ncbi:MAG TPA: amidophosphoribosyltransferase [Bacteroidia bacterium]|nr:amidophosphoribosyltransferase [Bacteroidia bacterium]
MTDDIHEECGIVLIRLLKPFSFYQKKYGSAYYGLHKLYLLMEKQHNRGQDGAGIADVKFVVPPGSEYMHRERSSSKNALEEIFGKVQHHIDDTIRHNPDKADDLDWLSQHIPYLSELLLGHLRYGTYGKNNVNYNHPFERHNNWRTKNLMIAGNFNLTNVDDLFDKLLELGQHPKEKTDTITILEKIGHFLDKENERLFRKYKHEGKDNEQISALIAENINIKDVLYHASKRFDGGYTIAGLMGHGDAFVMRDPNGIRPAFYYQDDEVVVVTSERPAIQTAFNVKVEQIKELKPGHALIIKKNKTVSEIPILPAGEKLSCSFERIYFSRGNDMDIYKERKMLGKLLTKPVLKALNYDIENTVFSFIPNTAELAFLGMVEEVENYLDGIKAKELEKGDLVKLKKILAYHPRIEKIALKDTKLRTFITNDINRTDKAAHVYDTTYGIIKPSDTLVVLDDSIVRGTTLKQSIFRILDRLGPKKIIVVSSAPQIRYPDCYGIDMAKIGDLVAFAAAVELLKESFKENLLEELYEKAKAMDELPMEEIKNVVKDVYSSFTDEQISAKITELLRPKDIHADVEIIYQGIAGLHQAIPNHKGDWYFTGNYPTPGGNKVSNRAFMNFMEGKNVRAY